MGLQAGVGSAPAHPGDHPLPGDVRSAAHNRQVLNGHFGHSVIPSSSHFARFMSGMACVKPERRRVVTPSSGKAYMGMFANMKCAAESGFRHGGTRICATFLLVGG